MEERLNKRIQTNLLLLIFISTVGRIVFASSMELGNTEAYYWVYATKLQWNYFDHPPLVAWLIRLTTLNLALHREIWVRAGAIICAAISTKLIFEIGCFIHSAKTGWYASLLYTSSPYASIAAGCFIMPDSPQMVF